MLQTLTPIQVTAAIAALNDYETLKTEETSKIILDFQGN